MTLGRVLHLLALIFISANGESNKSQKAQKQGTEKKKGEDGEDEDSKKPKYDLSLYKPGDLFQVPRTLFIHFGIYLGNNRVAHLIPDIIPMFSSNQDRIRKVVTDLRLVTGVIAKNASVRVDTVEDFAYGERMEINTMDLMCSQPPLDGDEIVRRAEKLVGPVAYSLLWFNCEHYVMYCRYGTAISFQTCQFCTLLRKIFLSRRCCYLTALMGLGLLCYVETVTPAMILCTIIIPFTIWMAS